MAKADQLKAGRKARSNQSSTGAPPGAPPGMTDFMTQLASATQQGSVSSQIVALSSSKIEVAGCELTPGGIDFPADVSGESLDQLMDVLFSLEGSIQIMIGDALVQSEVLGYGDIAKIAEHYSRDPKTLYNWKSIAKGVESSLRREVVAMYPDAKPLTVSHYEVLMGMGKADQRKWMQQALTHGYSVAKLKEAVKASALPDPDATVVKEWFTPVQDRARKDAKKYQADQLRQIANFYMALAKEKEEMAKRYPNKKR